MNKKKKKKRPVRWWRTTTWQKLLSLLVSFTMLIVAHELEVQLAKEQTAGGYENHSLDKTGGSLSGGSPFCFAVTFKINWCATLAVAADPSLLIHRLRSVENLHAADIINMGLNAATLLVTIWGLLEKKGGNLTGLSSGACIHNFLLCSCSGSLPGVPFSFAVAFLGRVM